MNWFDLLYVRMNKIIWFRMSFVIVEIFDLLIIFKKEVRDVSRGGGM